MAGLRGQHVVQHLVGLVRQEDAQWLAPEQLRAERVHGHDGGQRQVARLQLQVDLAFEVARDDPVDSCRLRVVRAPLGGDDPLVLGVDESEAHAHRAAELGKRVGRRVQRAALDPTDIGLRHA